MPGKLIAALVVLAGIAVAGDYHGVFGVTEEQVHDFKHLTFHFVDARKRTSVSDVHVACTRPMSRSACTERRGPEAGQTTITFGALREVRRSLLFSSEAGWSLGQDGVMYLSFIAPNHERAALELSSGDPILSAAWPHVIELVPTASE